MSGFVTVKFRTATVDFYQDSIVSTFNDGKTNSFALIWNNTPEYRQIASDMGYGDDWYRYGQEHELAHHFIADNLGWAYSWALRPFKGKPGPWPDHIAWEEHIVNKFQRFCRTPKTNLRFFILCYVRTWNKKQLSFKHFVKWFLTKR